MTRHRQRSSDSKRHIDWLNKSGEDMRAAELLLQHPECYNMCAFHCQQTIEKALKAYLLVASDRLLDGHNLTWLCRQALRYDKEFSTWMDESAVLNKFYIETRYPTDLSFALSRKRMEEVFKTAKEMYDFICSQVYEEQEEEMDKELAL
ncbi:HEPN domain-containing protein [Acetanaerobacterium elongatum]|uniref:HEPN domain-containing protein n=1 Tax=Acetanaerobacterium elongatum TaxID=258515 RepID=A0A1G9UGH3_9FIRM|nr:HEPN domain-containing protein [Acetanaerobacterium elongatum]SDM59060.1 HEPN domain-containing protein [Acetanaerobacterium elongatum]